MKSKEFKAPSAFVILLTIIAVIAVLTWFIPSGEWTGGVYKELPQETQGIYNILAAPIEGILSAIDVVVFILVMGGFLNVIIKTGAIDAGIETLVERNKDKDSRLIVVFMIILGLAGTTFGMASEIIAFYPLIIPLFLHLGYDVVTVVMVLLLGSGAGVLASTINPFAVGLASELAGTTLGVGLWHRLLLLILIEGLAIIFTLRYAKKVREDISNSIVEDLHEEHKNEFICKKDDENDIKFTKKRKLVLVLALITFIIMILGVIPWESRFNVTLFENAYNFLADKIPLLGWEPNTTKSYIINNKLIQTHPAPFGEWWFGQIIVWFFSASLIVGMVDGMKEQEIVDAFIEGAKNLIGVALIIGASRGIRVIMVQGKIDATILYWGTEMLKGFGKVAFINMMYLFYLPLSILIPSTSGLAIASIPIMAPLGDMVYGTSGGEGASLVVTAYAAANGVVNLITPTSGIVMGTMVITKLPYHRWVKHIFKFIIAISVVIMLLLSGVTFMFT